MKNCGDAFPCNTYGSAERGMTLRDYFAGQALTGLLACPLEIKTMLDKPDFAGEAYRYADAMLAEREKNDETK